MVSRWSYRSVQQNRFEDRSGQWKKVGTPQLLWNHYVVFGSSNYPFSKKQPRASARCRKSTVSVGLGQQNFPAHFFMWRWKKSSANFGSTVLSLLYWSNAALRLPNAT